MERANSDVARMKREKPQAVPQHLFVYGTLMRSGRSPYARLLRVKANYIGKALVPGRLYHLGAFPGAIVDGNSKGKVFGEIYRVGNNGFLSVLDRYEGCLEPPGGISLFRRKIVQASLATGGVVDAWIYTFAGSVAGRPSICSGRFSFPGACRPKPYLRLRPRSWRRHQSRAVAHASAWRYHSSS